jgi:PASTA domain
MSSPLHRAGAIATLAVLTALPFAFTTGSRAVLNRRAPLRPAVVQPAALVVPNVEGQAYVFAEGSLEDSGFAWRVSGRNGFAANTVVAQSPAPGTRVVDTGAPLVTLTVRRNRSYPQSGRPDNRSPYRGTSVRLAS